MNWQPDNEVDEESDEGVLAVEGEDTDLQELGDELIPVCGMEDDEVEFLNVPYCDRGPDDWVSAGTLDPMYAAKAEKHGWRRLRYFHSWEAAETWARNHFGDRFKGRVMDAVNSGSHWWAFVVAGPRGQGDFN